MHKYPRHLLRSFAIAIAACLIPAMAYAQDSRRPSAEEIVQRLSPAPPAEPGLTRGLGARGVQISPAATTPAAPPSIDLEVNFEFDSARLTTDAAIVLDNLGRALNDDALKRARIELGGHTDGIGNDDYNLKLSRARAQAVRDYLVTRHRVRPEQLTVTGYGRNRLIDASNPAAAVNRRVQITNLGEGK